MNLRKRQHRPFALAQRTRERYGGRSLPPGADWSRMLRRSWRLMSPRRVARQRAQRKIALRWNESPNGDECDWPPTGLRRRSAGSPGVSKFGNRIANQECRVGIIHVLLVCGSAPILHNWFFPRRAKLSLHQDRDEKGAWAPSSPCRSAYRPYSCGAANAVPIRRSYCTGETEDECGRQTGDYRRDKEALGVEKEGGCKGESGLSS
jgi:hypothetical protein